MPLKTLQVAVLGGDEDAVLVGLRNFPAHKIVLLAPRESMNQAELLAGRLTGMLRLTVEIKELRDSSIMTMLEVVGRLVRNESGSFQDFIINVGPAVKSLTCAAVTTAFVHGIRAFDVVGDQPVILPIMNFSYAKVITEPKLEIIRAIEKSGGEIESLEKLSLISNLGKPLLSYHIRGSRKGQGLEDLGLVEVERGKRGRLRVKLTGLGRTLLSTAIT